MHLHSSTDSAQISEAGNLLITRATRNDLEEILKLQYLAYQQEAALYHDATIPPLRETIEELRALFPQLTILKAVADQLIIGSVRAAMHEHTCAIGRLIVHPTQQRRGIGSALIHAIEAHFPQATRYELFTGHLSEGNIRLYQRLGYTIFQVEPITLNLSMVYLEKCVPTAHP